jgi:predicted DNA-binding protein
MRVSLPVELDDRLRALADMYEVAAGTIARAAIEAGLRAVTEQLRRAARSSARADGAREPPEADGWTKITPAR